MYASLKNADPKEKPYINLRGNFWCVSKLKTEKCAHWLYHVSCPYVKYQEPSAGFPQNIKPDVGEERTNR